MEASVIHQDVISSRSIPVGLDESENPLDSVPSYALLPELKSDEEIENVLHKISELLTSTSPSRTADINDSRSISEILREAEELVKDSSGYFEALSTGAGDICGGAGIRGAGGGSEASDNTDCSQELERDSPLCAENAQNGLEVRNIAEASKLSDAVPEVPEGGGVNISFIPITKPESALTPPSLRTPGTSPRKRPPSTLSLHSTTPLNLMVETSAPEPTAEQCPANNEAANEEAARSGSDLTEEAVPGHQASTPKRSRQVSPRSTPAQSPIHKRPCVIPDLELSVQSTWDAELQHKAAAENNSQHRPGTDTILDSSQDKTFDFEELQREYEEKISLLGEFEKMKKAYEEKIVSMEEEMTELKKKAEATEEVAEAAVRVTQLEKQLLQRESLLAASRDENATVRAEAAKARFEEKKNVLWNLLIGTSQGKNAKGQKRGNTCKCWSEAEKRLGDRVRKLEGDLRRANTLNTTEAFELREQLADAREQITNLEEENHLLKVEKRELEARIAEAEAEIRRKASEVARANAAVSAAEDALVIAREDEQMRIEERNRQEEITTASFRFRISNANTQLSAKESEVARLNAELGKVRGELERARLGSVLGAPAASASAQVRQLESALERQRASASATTQQVHDLSRRNADLLRQVKELEGIVKRRVRGSSEAPWASDAANGNTQPANGNPGEPKDDCNTHKVNTLEQRNHDLEELLEKKEKLLEDCTRKINDLQGKGSNVAARSVSSMNLGVRRHPPGSARSTQSAQSTQDSHMIATIRGLRADLSARDKQVARLQKELEECKKKKPMTPIGKPQRPQNSSKGEGSASSVSGNTELPTSKSYNPFLYEEDQEAILFLRNENQNLREEVKKLEQDLISLHNKRLHDLNEMEAQHSAELDRIRGGTGLGAQTRLKGQVYTQQMVISHLKSRVRQMEEKCRDAAMVEAERDELRASLTSLSPSTSRGTKPQDADVIALAAKVSELEKREAARRARVAALIAGAGDRASSARDCCADKNRQICFYRAEVDRMLEALSQLRNG